MIWIKHINKLSESIKILILENISVEKEEFYTPTVSYNTKYLKDSLIFHPDNYKHSLEKTKF